MALHCGDTEDTSCFGDIVVGSKFSEYNVVVPVLSEVLDLALSILNHSSFRPVTCLCVCLKGRQFINIG